MAGSCWVQSVEYVENINGNVSNPKYRITIGFSYSGSETYFSFNQHASDGLDAAVQRAHVSLHSLAKELVRLTADA